MAVFAILVEIPHFPLSKTMVCCVLHTRGLLGPEIVRLMICDFLTLFGP